MGAVDIPPIEISTFGHFLARRAGTGERGGGKGATQGAGGLPIAARLPRPSAPKCPKVATPIAPKKKSAFP
ncbi:unknown [Collinsella sp. CAG:398]|nr:unknown [Collinsella sp. CAG:398]